MNVTSLGLCKELYELSGWVSEFEHRTSDELETIGYQPPPAYDLGFLFRKLPLHIWVQFIPGNNNQNWTIVATDSRYSGNTIFEDDAGSPEDCTCKLVIELFKQGILKP